MSGSFMSCGNKLIVQTRVLAPIVIRTTSQILTKSIASISQYGGNPAKRKAGLRTGGL